MNRRWTGRLALVALAVQIVMAFGHTHVDRAFADRDTLTGQIAASSTADTASPAGGHPEPADHNDCALCAVIHLAGTIDLPPPVVLTVPDIAAPVWQVACDRGLRATHSGCFRARAPPHA